MLTLVADDDYTTRMLLQHYLQQWGFDVITATDGYQARDIILSDKPPRIALLDWWMPGLTGIDLCSLVRENEHKFFTYAIIITIETEKDSVIEALHSGAHDFLPKPVDVDLLRSRVNIGKRVANQQIAMEQAEHVMHRYAVSMEMLAEQRAKQLVATDRLATLGTVSAGVAHEINNPTSFVSGNVQTIERLWETVHPIIELAIANEHPEKKKLTFACEELPKAIDGIKNGVKRISHIVRTLRTYSRQNTTSEKKDCSVQELISGALEIANHVLKHNITVEILIQNNLPLLHVDPQQIQQVLINLLINSTHAMENTKNGQIILSALKHDDKVIIEISDSGPGIPSEYLEKIWAPFFTTKPAGKGSGLGLYISRGIITDHGGKMTADNMPTGGAKFSIELPIENTCGAR